jgi:hypothetical protein
VEFSPLHLYLIVYLAARSWYIHHQVHYQAFQGIQRAAFDAGKEGKQQSFAGFKERVGSQQHETARNH